MGEPGGPEDYAAYYRARLEIALIHQDFVVDLAHKAGLVIQQYASKAYQLGVGETLTGVEIKHDEQFARTGNLWIETAENATQRDGPYAASGIYREGEWS
jgi:hypothetical protein